MSLFSRKRVLFSRFTWVAIVALVGMIILCGIAPAWTDTAMALQASLSELPITFPVQSPEVAAYFGRIARPYDVASFSPSQTHLLPEDALGQRMERTSAQSLPMSTQPSCRHSASNTIRRLLLHGCSR